MTQPAIIAIDWGTTNFRAFLLSVDAVVLDTIQAPKGVLNIVKGAFAENLQHLINKWLQQYPTLPIIMSGMVGSSSGWVEVPYQVCPIDPAVLSANLFQLPNINAHALYIVPGLRLDDKQARADVMRGEETQLFGIMKDANVQCCCLPGTHSKWVSVQNKKIKNFTTYMTGELFSLLSKQSILHKQIEASVFNQAEFIRGVKQTQNDQGLLANCFNVRAQFLMGDMLSQDTESYLSGLLVGYELLAAKPYWQLSNEVAVVATESVMLRYCIAMQYFSIKVLQVNGEQAVVQGLMMLAKQAGLI